MLNYISHPLFKDRIIKTISSWYLYKGNHQKAIQYGLALSENKNYFFEFLSEQLNSEEVLKFLKDWLKFDYKEVYTLGISDLVSPKTNNNGERFLKEIQQDSQNFWSDVYLVMNLYQKNIIKEETFRSEIDILFKKIPILNLRIYQLLNFLKISTLNENNTYLGDMLNYILDNKKSELNADRDDKIYKNFLIKRLNRQVLLNLDLNQPFNYKSKFQTIKNIFILNFYRPINTLNQPIEYFIESSFKSIYRFISYTIVGLVVFLIPGFFSKLKLKFQLKKIYTKLYNGNVQKAVDEFCVLENSQALSSEIGLHFFTTVFQNMVKKNQIVDISNILGYPNFYWDKTQKSEMLTNYLLLPEVVKRNEKYLGNLERMLNPNSISEQAIVLSSYFFKSNKRLRFSAMYSFAVQKIMETGEISEFEEIMDLKRYKAIYQSMH